jgi:hypothetical protein
MGQALAKCQTILIDEDDLDLRHLTATLLADEQLETMAALASDVLGGR